MVKKNLAFQVAYDGSHFHGYGIQPIERTVQGELEIAFRRLFGDVINSLCAGRTDAGVHALTQLVQIQTAHPMPVTNMPQALNKLLSNEIQIINVFELAEGFSARYSALARHYRYVIYLDDFLHPVFRNQVWQCSKKLDFELIQEVWRFLQGPHHFKAICKSGSYRVNFDIDVISTRFKLAPPFLTLDIVAPSFVYNMVRALVGTTLEIGRGRFSPDHMRALLDSKDNRFPKLIAPPQGLYFYNVIYPDEYGLCLQGESRAQWPLFLH